MSIQRRQSVTSVIVSRVIPVAIQTHGHIPAPPLHHVQPPDPVRYPAAARCNVPSTGAIDVILVDDVQAAASGGNAPGGELPLVHLGVDFPWGKLLVDSEHLSRHTSPSASSGASVWAPGSAGPAVKWVRQRCQPAPAITKAMAFFNPWWAQEGQPKHAVLDCPHVPAQRFPRPASFTPVTTNTLMLMIRPPFLILWVRDPPGQGVRPHVGIWAAVQGPGQEGFHHFVLFPADAADLAPFIKPSSCLEMPSQPRAFAGLYA